MTINSQFSTVLVDCLIFDNSLLWWSSNRYSTDYK